MEQKDGEKVSMESSVSNGKVEEGTGRCIVLWTDYFSVICYIRLCWVCDWLAFDLAICHINYSGDVDLLYEDQDLNCFFCCRYIANICSTCKQILVWIVISCYW